MKAVPQPTIERLLGYYRYLQKVVEYKDIDYISSMKLGNNVGVSAAKVRKDLSYFGEFGCKGVGYQVGKLLNSIKEILGIDKTWPVALVGAGNLGQALISYPGFRRMGIDIAAIFDCDLNKIGREIDGLRINSIKRMEKIVREKNIKLAILTVPADEAEEVASKLIAAGIRAIWNFAPVALSPNTGKNVVVFSDDISSGLASLLYRSNSNIAERVKDRGQ